MRKALLFLFSALLIFGSIPSRAQADDASIGNLDTVLQGIQGAQSSITISAYTINENQAILPALEDAANKGIHVHLVLTNEGFGYAISQNRRIYKDPHGITVTLLDRAIHMKGIVVDSGNGLVALDDTNWSKDGTVLTVDKMYALDIERAIVGDPHDKLPLTTTKGSSLRFEALMINNARQSVKIETESFSANNPVADALVNARKRQVTVTLIVNKKEYNENSGGEKNYIGQTLEPLGIKVEFQDGDQKGMIIDNNCGWIGSSNATSGLEDQIDWGYGDQSQEFMQGLNSQLSQY